MKFNSVLQGGAKLGDETSKSEKMGVVQSSGTDFEQILFFSEKKRQLRKFWMSWKNCLARMQWMTSLFLPMSICRH